jgi:hypothetical protein
MGWFLYGLFVGAGGMRIVLWDMAGQLNVAWYTWLLLVISVALTALTGQHFFASFKELEPRAAWLGLLFMGIPTVAVGSLVAWLL